MARSRIPKKIRAVVKGYGERLTQKNKLSIDRLIIFGSYAKGAAHRQSDVDVCVISPQFNDPLEAIRLLLHKRNNDEVRAGIEPVGFTLKNFKEGGSLINEIKRTGVEIRLGHAVSR